MYLRAPIPPKVEQSLRSPMKPTEYHNKFTDTSPVKRTASTPAKQQYKNPLLQKTSLNSQYQQRSCRKAAPSEPSAQLQYVNMKKHTWPSELGITQHKRHAHECGDLHYGDHTTDLLGYRYARPFRDQGVTGKVNERGPTPDHDAERRRQRSFQLYY